MDADEIVVIENGRVVDRGTHNSLLQKSNSLYWRLWDTQNSNQTEEGPEPINGNTKETRQHA